MKFDTHQQTEDASITWLPNWIRKRRRRRPPVFGEWIRNKEGQPLIRNGYWLTVLGVAQVASTILTNHNLGQPFGTGPVPHGREAQPGQINPPPVPQAFDHPALEEMQRRLDELESRLAPSVGVRFQIDW